MSQPKTAVWASNRMADVLKWKIQIPPHRPGVRSTPLDKERVVGAEVELPFGIRLDTPETDGARGVWTERGVNRWLQYWLQQFGDATKTRTDMAGATLLNKLQNGETLDDPALWGVFTKELATLWWKVAGLTGNAPERRALCPKCRKGWLQSTPGKQGFSDVAVCANPHCSVTVNYSREETSASFRAVMRTVAPDDNHWLDIKQIRVVWPRLPGGTLRRWVHENKVRKRGNQYSLGDVNVMKLGASHEVDKTVLWGYNANV